MKVNSAHQKCKNFPFSAVDSGESVHLHWLFGYCAIGGPGSVVASWLPSVSPLPGAGPPRQYDNFLHPKPQSLNPNS